MDATSTTHDNNVNRPWAWGYALRGGAGSILISLFASGLTPARRIADYLGVWQGSTDAWLAMMTANFACFAFAGYCIGLARDIKVDGFRRHRVAVGAVSSFLFLGLLAALLHISILRVLMVHYLKDERAEMRCEAAYGMQWLGTHARPAIPDVLSALNDKDPRVRWHLATALSHCVQPKDTALIERLIDMHKTDPSEHVRWHVAQLLMGHGDLIPKQLRDKVMGIATDAPEENIWAGYSGGQRR